MLVRGSQNSDEYGKITWAEQEHEKQNLMYASYDMLYAIEMIKDPSNVWTHSISARVKAPQLLLNASSYDENYSNQCFAKCNYNPAPKQN